MRAADFALAIFEPEPGLLPDVKNMRQVENLHLMRFESNSGGLTELREAFKEANMRREERQVTYALKHTERLKAGWIERLFHYVLFEFTCQYGMSPGRTLRILGFLIPVFAIPYAFALQQANKRAGIWTTLITARTEKRFRVKPRSSKKRARRREHARFSRTTGSRWRPAACGASSC